MIKKFQGINGANFDLYKMQSPSLCKQKDHDTPKTYNQSFV